MDSQQSLLEWNADYALQRIDFKPFSGKSVLLTGATGLIGVNLESALKKAGISKLATPHRTLPTLGSYDYVIHAAGYAQPARFMADPLGTIAVNTTMLVELLGRLAPKGRLLFLSTSEIYSGNTRGLHVEADIGTTNPAAPRAAYIESKRCGEAICHAALSSGKQAIIARVASVYGPGVRPNDTRVMSQFIDRALSDGEITLRDNGNARRVFLYVADAVEMLLNLLLHAEGTVYNVGASASRTHRECIQGDTSIITLARKIGELTKVPVKAPNISGTVGHGLAGARREAGLRDAGIVGAPQYAGVDIGRYVREFGKDSFVPLDEGLKRTVAWHREMLGVTGKVAA